MARKINKKDIGKMSLFALTWPLFIEILLHMLMGNADTLMLSQYSDNSVAAVGVSNQILSIVIVMFGFIATGTAILIAQHLGAKEQREAKEVAVVSILGNLLFGLVLSLVLYFYGRMFLQLMGIPAELMEDAYIYLVIVGGFSFVQAIVMTVGAIIRSYGFTKDSMYVTIGMNLLNVLGNYLFIFGAFGFPELGVKGVAISTIVSRVIGLGFLIWLMLRRVEGTFPFKRVFTLPFQHTKNLLTIGIPSAGEHLAYNTSQFFITYFITKIGTEALTAKVYTQNIMMFVMLFSIAISQGTQILIGHMIGARKYEDAYRRCLNSLKPAIIISLGAAIVVSIFSKQLLGIFTDNQAILSVSTTLIFLTILLEPGRSINLVVINSLRAAGDVRFPVYMGILSMWGVSVTISYVLGIHYGLGLIGVWISFIADEWLRGIIMLFRWKSRVWMNKTFMKQEEQPA
ncbi:MATE family efflux transporter [Bacillus suaedaesalsae]|uniref:MATE family efflux transporter n=1 Tax=Bacillus suaedaesalsae TaxID=2810349 RepID=A0ABS2DFC8_9BACI|nr:MATE family efflux transporter [Bacillus suaedaesalsae]MBM6617116.1 MATE family efflux transporter [Bacillus suaedaesalsae]